MARRNYPLHRFQCQRSAAKARGIDWELTFEQWWAIWRDSGKWDQRGCKRGQYVMARDGDQGPYAVDNVSIMEAGMNGSQALKGWGAKKKAREDRVAAEIASGPTTADNLQTLPSSTGCRCGTEAANYAIGTAIAVQTSLSPVQLYDQPQSDASSHSNGTSSHKFSKSTNGAIATQALNKNLDHENEIGLSLIDQMVELLEKIKKFMEKNFTKQNAKRPGSVY